MSPAWLTSLSPPSAEIATDAAAYTYTVAPTVTNVVPNAGPVAGGTSVTITGTGFTGAIRVRFGGGKAKFHRCQTPQRSRRRPRPARTTNPVL